MTKRSLFNELRKSVEEMELHRRGKITLREFTIKPRPRLAVTARLIRQTRRDLNLSRAVFAHQLGVSPRTLEKWELGTAAPNDPAATLILLVRRYPDMLRRLATLSGKAA